MPKILLLEDNDVNRDMLSRRLHRYGYEVVIGCDGTEALPKARTEVPDLVLMDMSMPVMDGWEATQQLKSDVQVRDIPVIALTAHAMDGDREKALEAGCDGYDTKPINFDRLVGKIEALLSPTSVITDAEVSGLPRDPSPINKSLERQMLQHLRHELCTPINAIIGYSEILLEEVSKFACEKRYRDLQQIYAAGLHLLAATDMALDPEQLEGRPIAGDIDSFRARVRLELLTPLDKVVDVCDRLIEHSPIEQRADLNRIHSAAQHLLGMINDIVTLAQQQIQTLVSQPATLIQLRVDSPASNSFAQTANKLMQSMQLSTARRSGGSILVVDDNQINCDLLSRQLERQGYSVTTVNRGLKALDCLQQTSYDLVLLDIFMPDINGLDVLSQIKQSPDLQAIPVIMISALNELDSVVGCIEMGAEDFISKPFNPVFLQAKIKASLEKKKLQEQHAMCMAQRVVAGATPVPIFISRMKDGRILYANLAAESAIGLPVKMLLEKSTIDFYLNPKDCHEIVDTVSKQKTVYRQEIQCKRANGKMFWVAASIQPLMFGNEPTMLSVLYDISGRKRAEQALSLAEESYRSIFEHALEGIFQASPDGRYVRVNPTMARICGFETPQKMMLACPTLWDKAWVDTCVKTRYERALSQSGQVESLEYQCYRQDGTTIWLEENSQVVCDHEGEILYYEGIIQEITERKSSEAALKRQIKKMRVEIDQVKREQDVKKISQMDYFQHLMAEANSLRLSENI